MEYDSDTDVSRANTIFWNLIHDILHNEISQENSYFNKYNTYNFQGF